MDRDNDIQTILFDKTSSTSAQTVIDGVSNKYLRIREISISTDTAQSVRLEDEDGKGIVGRKFLPANSVWSKSYSKGKTVNLGKALKVVCGGSSGNVTIDIEYIAKS